MNTQIDTRMDQETISALMDGQLSDADLSDALRGMTTDEARESWLLYHLAGDVLRSADLARGRHDLAFVERVSQRLGAQVEPAESLVPMPIGAVAASQPAANDSVFRWKLAAGLASLAAVAAIGWGAWSGSVGPAASVGPQLAQTMPEARAVSSAAQVQVAMLPATPPASVEMQATAQEPVMLRDPRLDELLAAHRAAAGASALDSSGVFLRNATFQGGGH